MTKKFEEMQDTLSEKCVDIDMQQIEQDLLNARMSGISKVKGPQVLSDFITPSYFAMFDQMLECVNDVYLPFVNKVVQFIQNVYEDSQRKTAMLINLGQLNDSITSSTKNLCETALNCFAYNMQKVYLPLFKRHAPNASWSIGSYTLENFTYTSDTQNISKQPDDVSDNDDVSAHFAPSMMYVYCDFFDIHDVRRLRFVEHFANPFAVTSAFAVTSV